jgi:hypothetical protein
MAQDISQNYCNIIGFTWSLSTEQAGAAASKLHSELQARDPSKSSFVRT